jgi:hypothetical protein
MLLVAEETSELKEKASRAELALYIAGWKSGEINIRSS